MTICNGFTVIYCYTIKALYALRIFFSCPCKLVSSCAGSVASTIVSLGLAENRAHDRLLFSVLCVLCSRGVEKHGHVLQKRGGGVGTGAKPLWERLFPRTATCAFDAEGSGKDLPPRFIIDLAL